MADDAGSLLLRAGLVGNEQLMAARAEQAASGGTLGEHLVLAGLIDDEELTAFYRNRLLVPRIDPNDLSRIPKKVIELIPADMAAEFRVVPVYLDREHNLTLAMSDPSHTHAVDELGFYTATYVVRAVATQRQIAWCLAHYYGILTPLGRTLLATGPDEEDEEPEADEDEGEEIVIDAEEPDDDELGAPLIAPGPVTERVQAMRHRVVPPVDADDRLETGSRAMFSGQSSYQPSNFDHEVTGETGPVRARPKPRRRSREPTPPELAPRAGEVEVPSKRRLKPDSTPAIFVDPAALEPEQEEQSEAAVPEPVEEEGVGSESRPFLLRSKAEKEQADPAAPREPSEGGDSDVVLLDQPKEKPRKRRKSKSTDLGLGALGTAKGKRKAREARDTDVSPPPLLAEEGKATGDAAPKAAEAAAASSVDDGWGPPGTTIPPEFLGAMPGTYDQSEPGGVIPIPVDDDLTTPNSIVAAARAHVEAKAAARRAGPERTRPKPEPEAAAEELSAGLEESSLRLVETLRLLDRATTRDEVIEQLIEHLRDICTRVAFFAARKGGLVGFAARGPGADEARVTAAKMSLEKPSTLRDAVRARLPYHGPVADDATRHLLEQAFGAPPAEILAVPVTVRERVVGLLYGDGKRRPLFSAHLAAVCHAAGLALERILKKKVSDRA